MHVNTIKSTPKYKALVNFTGQQTLSFKYHKFTSKLREWTLCVADSHMLYVRTHEIP